ncbi:MAG: RidA family protein [Candidatus Bathyarchaeia archaeon]
MSRKVVSPGDLISGAIVVGDLVFTAGMTGGSGDTETQIRNTFSRLKDVLEKAGTSMENVVKATVYLTDLADRERYLNKIWKEMFPKNPPARTCIQAGLAGDTKVEIEMIAVIPKK